MNRIFDNKHVDRYVMSAEDRLRHCHTEQDIINTLHLNKDGQFDSDSSSKDFSVTDIEKAHRASQEVMTIYESDRIGELYKTCKDLEAKELETAQQQ